MVKTQAHVITYLHPFAAVTSSLWSKYDHHKYVQNIEILDRHVDEHGRLHSTRLLSMCGNLPCFIKAFVPMKHVHMLETVVVDPVTQIMTVETSNITCRTVMDARSRSRYSPSHEDPNRTKYEIAIFVRAFPCADYAPSAFTPAAGSESAATSRQGDAGKSEWKLKIVTGGGPAAGSDQTSLLSRWQQGYIAGKMESWVVNKLLSNVNKGEQYIDGFCRRWRERHYMLCESFSSQPQLASTAVGLHLSPSDCSQLEKQVREGAGKEMSQAVRSAVNKQLRLSRFLSWRLSLFQRATDAHQ